jgi:hypothetical protein
MEQVIETTLQGPEQITELATFHLHRLGCTEAKDVVFLVDGTEWIWDRVPMIAKKAGLNHWLAAVDFFHTMEYIVKAVNENCRNQGIRKKNIKQIRKSLLDGRVEEVLSMLRNLVGADTIKEVQDAVRYIKNRLPLMRYDQLKAKKLPIGSGAVESAVRRVINLRIKSPGMFWDADNVEAIMYLRANALSEQRETMLKRTYQHTRTTRRRDWKGNLTPILHQSS